MKILKKLARLLCWLDFHPWRCLDIQEGHAIYECERCKKREEIQLYGI